MARRRFFVSKVLEGGAAVEGDEARHLTRVLRVEAGQRFEITDGASGVYLAEVASAGKEFVKFRVLEDVPAAAAVVRVLLLASLIKFDHFELLIEKATELGVSEIIPVITTRTETGLEKAVPKRMERWQRIALEASQQSRRDHLPKIWPAIQFGEALRSNKRWSYWLDEEMGGAPLFGALPAARCVDDSVALLIGPEGGWTPSEREAAVACEGWTRVSLGPQILRAETAAIAALAVVMAGWQVTAGN